MQAKQLLQLFGVPYIVAPMEAEAQCAQLELCGAAGPPVRNVPMASPPAAPPLRAAPPRPPPPLPAPAPPQVDGVVTEDNDTFLFGARHVYKNLFDASRNLEAYQMADVEAELSVDRQKLARARVITRGRHGLATPGRLGRAAGEGGAQGGRSERARARAWSGRGRGVQRKRARRVKDEADRHPAVAGAAGAAARLRLHGRRARRGHRQRDGGALRSFLLSRTISAPPPPLARDLRAPSRRRAALPLLPRNQLRAVSPQVLGSFTEEAGGLAAFRRWVSSWRSDADAAADEVEAAGSGDDDEQQAAADGTRARLRKFKTRHRKVRRNWTLPDDFPSAQARARRRRGPKRHALAP